MRYKLNIAPVVPGDEYEIPLRNDEAVVVVFRKLNSNFWIAETYRDEQIFLSRRILSGVDIFGGGVGVTNEDGVPYSVVVDDISKLEDNAEFVLDTHD